MVQACASPPCGPACIAPGTPISFSCDTSPAAIAAFQANNPGANNATVGTGSGAYVATGAPVVATTPYQATAPTQAEIANCPALVFYNGVCANPVTGGSLNTQGGGNSTSAASNTSTQTQQPNVSSITGN